MKDSMPPTVPIPYDQYMGSGEMSLLTRQYDWGNTALGGRDSWPPLLHFAVNTLLDSAFPMLLFWGPELLCFYNDAFRPSLGMDGKHPGILGQNVAEAFPELWKKIQPFFDHVMQTGAPVYRENLLVPILRNGRLEDAYWNVNYSAVREADGLVRGVMVICTETTSNITRYRNIVESATGPIMIFTGEDLVVEEANAATLELWGVDRSVIGRPFLEVKPEFRTQGFPELIRAVLRTGNPFKGYEYPAIFIREGGREELRYYNFEYTPYREASGDITGVVIVAIDVTDQLLGKKQLSIAEEEMQIAVQAADLGYWNLNPRQNTFKSNAQTRRLFGLPEDEDVDLQLAIENIHPDDRERVEAAIRSALNFEKNGNYDCEYRVINPSDGQESFVRAIGKAYTNAAGEVIRFSGTVQDFTKHKAAEEELRRQVRFTESIIEASPSVTYIYNLVEGVNAFVSTQVERLLGYTSREVQALGKDFLPAILHPDELGSVQQHFRAIVSDPNGGVHDHEYRARHKEGRWIWLYDRSRVYDRAADGQPTKILGISTDITERKNLELLMASRFDELETVYRTAPVGLCLINRDLLFVRINEHLAEINGMPAADHIGRSIFEVVPDIAPQAAPLLRTVFDTGEPIQNIELKGQTRAMPGVERVWNESWYPVQNEAGDVIAVSVVAQEVTEQRRALEALEASEARFQNLVRDTSAAIIVLTGPEMTVAIVNKAYGRLVGLEPDDMLGKPLFAIIPDAERDYRPILENVYLSGQSVQINDSPYSVTTNGISFEGYLHVMYQPYSGPNGEIQGVMAILQDVSESVKTRKALEESEARFRSFIEQSPVATCLMVGRSLRIELANEIMIGYWGKNESVIGKPLREALPELEGQPFLQILDDVFISGQQFDAYQTPAEIEVNGTLATYYFNFTYKPLFNQDGQVYAILNTAIDVTSEVRAKNELKESEQRYRRLLESNIAGVLFWDLDKGITDANNSFLEMIGYSREELGSGLHWDTITPPQWKEKDEASIAELLATGKSAPFEKQYIRKDGSIIDVLIANTALDGTANRRGVSFLLDITEQKKSEAALRESEGRFRSLAADAPAFIFMANANAEIEYINETWIRFTGLSPENALGQGWALVTHPDDLKRSFDIYNRAFENRTEYQYEMQQRGADGTYHWIHWRGIPRFLPNGEFLGILGFGFDITERKKSEQALQASEDLFRSFSDNIQNLAWIADGDGWINWYNQRWYDFTGTTYEEMQGWGWEKVHHPDHIDRVIAFVKDAWKKPQAWELTFPLRSAEGDYQWFLTRAVPVIRQDGTISRWIGTNTNIDEQKRLSNRLEELVAERTEELSMSRAFLQGVLNSAQTTISTFEAIRNRNGAIIDFRITYINNNIEDELGEEAASLEGRTCREAFPHIFETGEFEKFVSCVETGTVLQYETRYEQDGNAIWYYVSLAKMRDGLTATSLNMTKEKEAAEKLAELNSELDERNRQLQRSNEDLQQFAHVASHDLKEPVRKIRTFSSRLKEEFGDLLPERGLSFLSRIEKGADRMYDMIDGVLLYSSLDTMQQTREEVPLGDVFDNIEADLEVVIAEKNAVIEKSGLPSVEGVPILIYQLFYNLINNSLKFSKIGLPPRIRISALPLTTEESIALNLKENEQFLQVLLQDNGIGFSEEASERIFQTFTRLHAKDKYEGTGLGLSLCRKIVERHGGRIWAESMVQEGASFHVILPLFEKR